MKKTIVILNAVKNLIILAAISLITSCDKVNVAELEMGQLPDEEVLSGLPAINLRAVSSPDNIVRINLPEGGSFTSVKVYVQASRELDASQTVILSVDEELLEAYNTQNKTDFSLLPAPYYSIDNGGVIDIPAGVKVSDEKLVRIYATNPIGNVLEAGNYLLPLKASMGGVVYVMVTVQAPFSGRPDLYTGEDCFTVFYLNTSQYDPRLVTDYVPSKMDASGGWTGAIGHIVNFTTLYMDYDDATKAPVLRLSPDMQYLLDNFDKYFRPVQETGRKLCLCIETGSPLLGFCNMSDDQISLFVAQIIQVVNQYGFDGINLWDRNCSYGENSFPVNTVSYPRLIAELRKALGPYKLLTLTDYEEPTAYFWDVDAMGGIAVGELIDYAWSGYYSTGEPIQIIDPWHPDNPGVSLLHPRKPIAGLSPSRYGCIMATRRPFDDGVSNWAAGGYVLNNISVVYELETYLQGKMEGMFTAIELLNAMCTDGQYIMVPHYFYDRSMSDGDHSGYNAWKKDW